MADCQSCGIPMDASTTSKYDVRYCVHCQDQETGKLKTFEEVRQATIEAAMRFRNLSRKQAEIQAQNLKNLPRWQNASQEQLTQEGAAQNRTDTKPPEDFGKPKLDTVSD